MSELKLPVCNVYSKDFETLIYLDQAGKPKLSEKWANKMEEAGVDSSDPALTLAQLTLWIER